MDKKIKRQIYQNLYYHKIRKYKVNCKELKKELGIKSLTELINRKTKINTNDTILEI